MCSHFPVVPAVKVLLQLKEAWGIWASNSNATTVCAAWDGVTCSPKGLVVALLISLLIAALHYPRCPLP
ncbi:unnamed protein product [Closterium sp. NIES-65]|nr:unnamed protein product [Closterium sp. NIES-65]